jgi:hypothetical protein
MEIFFQFLVMKTVRVGIQPKMLDPDPEPMYPDPKHWIHLKNCLSLIVRPTFILTNP